jgi:hypothetical protein
MKKWDRIFMLLALAWATSAQATTTIPMYLDDLTAESQTVVHGTVIASRTEWDENRRMIYTIYTIAPMEYMKGNLGATFELREPGGERDGIGMTVVGVPEFSAGQEAVLFVWTDREGRHQVTAFEQGAVEIATDPQTGVKKARRGIPLGSARATPAAASAVPSAILAQQAAPETSRSLPQLFQQIRSSVATRQRSRVE